MQGVETQVTLGTRDLGSWGAWKPFCWEVVSVLCHDLGGRASRRPRGHTAIVGGADRVGRAGAALMGNLVETGAGANLVERLELAARGWLDPGGGGVGG